MADSPISGLPNSLALTGSEKFPLVQAATTVQASINDILALAAVPGATNGLQPITGNIGLGGNLIQNTSITGNFDLSLGTSGNKLANLNSFITGNLNLEAVNLEASFTGEAYLNTDAGIGNTPSVYLTPTSNEWYIGSNQASFNAQFTQVDYNGQYLNINATQIMPLLTPSRVLILDASKFITSSSVTTTQLNVLTAFNANVIGSTLTGYVSGSGTISATDTVLSAIEKLNGNVALLTGAVIYQGTWNANTNSPALASGVGTKGYLYKVSVAGTTTIDGISSWNVGDQIVFNGTAWDKIDGIPNEVLSVNGLVGAVPLTGSSAINISGTNVFSINNASITNAMLAGSIDLTSKVTGVLPSANGGTGINNGTSTITIGGNFALSGAYTFTGTLTNNTAVTFPTSGTIATLAGTETLTNKRKVPRTTTVTQSATPTVNTDNADVFSITGLTQAITSMTTNLSGTPSENEKIIIQITDDGTARSITWGSSFASTTVSLPTTTVASTMLRIGLSWNSSTSKWDCLAVA